MVNHKVPNPSPNNLFLDLLFQKHGQADQSSLADDLQITPENSDNEDNPKKFGGNLFFTVYVSGYV